MQQIIIVILTLSFWLGNLIKVSVFSPQINISILDISLILAAIYNHKKILDFAKIHRTRLLINFIMIAFLSLCLGSVRFGPTAFFVGLSYLVRFILYISSFAYLPKKISPIALGIGAAMIGILQYLFVPDMRFMSDFNWDPHYYRIVGAFLDPGFTGLIYVFTIIYIYIHKNTIPYPKMLLFISYIALAFTYSRSSYLAFLSALAFIAYKKHSKSFFVKFSLLLLVTILILPRPGGEGIKLERTSTIRARITSWSNSIKVGRESPIIGVGFNLYRYAQADLGILGAKGWQENHAGAGADSSLLFVFATVGIVGLIIYLIYIKQYIRQLPVYWIPLLVHSLFLNSLFYPYVIFFMSAIMVREHKSPFSLHSSDFQPDQWQ